MDTPILTRFIREVMETVHEKVHFGFDPSIVCPGFGIMAGLFGLAKMLDGNTKATE